MEIKEGDKFGNYTVIKFDKAVGPYGKYKYYLCRCLCGREVSVRSYGLIRGTSKSCGCGTVKKLTHPRVDYTGLKFGELEVVREVSHKLWELKCSCGNTILKKSNSLSSGKKRQQSCGCKTSSIITEKTSTGIAYLTYLYRSYTRNAVKRNFKFNLSLTEFEGLIKSNCHYCGIEPNNVFAGTTYLNKFLHHGVDRVNTILGYEPANCVTACKTCNVAKSSLTENDFYAWIKRIYNHTKERIK